ncbi:MAG: hypothetical protein LRY74_10035, partial [Shewanella xiamenensis]|nr:hypothetical protein [Shewanella xiamenensis]
VSTSLFMLVPFSNHSWSNDRIRERAFSSFWELNSYPKLRLIYINAGVLDASGDIESIRTFGGFVSYRHWWNEQWRTSVTFSGMQADNDVALTGTGVNKDAYSGYINLLYSPSKPLTFGVEYMYAQNSKENGDDGDLSRIIFSAKYVL